MSARTKSSSKAASSASASAASAAAAAAPSPARPAASSSSAASAAASASAASAATLQVFWDLAKEDPAERAAACAVLLRSLSAEQDAYTASGGPAKAAATAAAAQKIKEESEDEDDDEHEADTPLPQTVLPSTISPPLVYALKRLTRGLASSRAGARQGFALALTEILKSFPKEVVATEDVIKIVEDQIKLNTKANKQETRDYHLGRVFFALVLVRSDRILSLPSPALYTFVREMIEYAKLHLPIREVSYETLAQIVAKLPWKQWESSAELRKYILAEIANKSLEELSIEQIGLSLAIREYYESNLKELPTSSNTPKPEPVEEKKAAAGSSKDGKDKAAAAAEAAPQIISSSVRKLLSSKYLPVLHQSLFRNMQHYATTEKLHSTWTHLLVHLWRHCDFAKFAAFWTENIDGSLFGGPLLSSPAEAANPTLARNTSYQKKFIGFQIVSQVLHILPGHYARAQGQSGYASKDGLLSSPGSLSQIVAFVVSSRNFLRTFANNLAGRKNVLYGMALAVKKQLVRFGSQNPQEILTIVSALEDASAGGHLRFDARTNSDTVLKLLEQLDSKGVETYVHKLQEMFIKAAPVTPTAAETEEANQAASAAATAAAAAAAKKKGGKKGAAAAPAAPAAPASASASLIEGVSAADLAQNSLDSLRGFCIDQLFALGRNKNLPSASTAEQEGSWLHQILQFFLYFGFFDCTGVPAKNAPFPTALDHPLSAKVRASLQEKLFHLLDELLPHAPVVKRIQAPSGHKEKRLAADKAKAAAKKAAAAGADGDEDMTDEATAAKPEESIEQSLAHYNALFAAGSASIPWALRVHQDWTAWSSAAAAKGKKAASSALTMVSPLSKEESAARTKSLEFVEDLRARFKSLLDKTAGSAPSEEDKTTLAQLRSLQLLLLHLSLLLLKSEEREFATPLLEEVEEGVAAFFAPAAPAKTPKKGAKKAAAAPEADADKPAFINVLVDILLSLLIRPSNLFRDISRSVFAAFGSLVNDGVIEDLMVVLRRKTKEGAGGEGEEDEDEDSDNFPSSDEEEEEEKKSSGGKASKKAPQPGQGKKASALDAEAAANAKKFAHLAAGSDSDEDDDEMVDIAGLNAVFASSGPQGKVDGDSSDDDAELDLQKAASYDHHLSNIVRLRAEKKSAHKEYALQSLHFKLRVCDLVEVFIRTQAESAVILECFLPMLVAIDASRGNKENQQLLQRLTSLYKILCGSKERPAMTPTLLSAVQDLQKLLMSRALKTVHRETLHLTNLALMFLTKIAVPHEIAEQVAETEKVLAGSSSSSASGNKKKAAAAPVDSPVAFVLNLYKHELVQYISVKHSLLNTKFFTDFCTRFPGLAWSFVGPLAQMAQAKLPESKDASAGAHPYAANAFLRNDCFLLLGTIFGNRHVLKDHDVLAKFSSFLPSIQEAIRSTLIASTLPRTQTEVAEDAAASAKKEAEDDSDDEDAAAEDEPEGGKKKSGGSKDSKELKREREKAKARAKKKRRELKKKEAARALALASGKGPDSEEGRRQLALEQTKSNIGRLKSMLKFANQAAITFAPAAAASASSPSPLFTPAISQALSSLPATLATPLKSTLYTFLQSARVSKDNVKLQLDEESLAAQRAKPNPNQAKKKDAAAAAASSKGKSAPAAGSAKKGSSSPATNGKSSGDKKRSSSAVAPAASASSSASNGHAEKKQRTASSSSPAAAKSPAGSASPKKRSADDAKKSSSSSSSAAPAKDGDAKKKQRV